MGILITLSLMAIVLVSLLSIISGNSFVGVFSYLNLDSNIAINGTDSSVGLDASSAFGIDPVAGAIIMFVSIGAIALVGTSVIGTGLSDASVRIIVWVTVYGIVWGIFSVLSFNLIIAIELWGSLIYIALTLMYVIGVIQKLVGGG